MTNRPDTINPSVAEGIITGRFSRRAMLAGLASIPAIGGATAAIIEPEMTDDEFMALDWAPWEHQEGEFVPPTNQQWYDEVNPTLISIRIAWTIMYKTKAELIEMLGGLDNEKGADEDKTMAVEMYERIAQAAERIDALHDVLHGARSRLMIAGLNVGHTS
ncbi:hypothetical protein FJ970_18065 [Mesorhizobium sp. B2-1-8]|uniref:hypothetical protein n=1 Tax=Mesorhizobium sp. B2-1-8 TaxID=2589967 RepID=UPI00112B430D|nr:hypothetical protein [Mesorhizobium sp. B2-1-8]UCI17039.1 hypothetical protein FJ970_18065 [Mesorhizobium sp. B2-1-8]